MDVHANDQISVFTIAAHQDGLVGTLNNVLAFDQYDDALMASLRALFQRHGIPLGIGEAQLAEKLTPPQPLPPAIPTESWAPAGAAVQVAEVVVQALETADYSLGAAEVRTGENARSDCRTTSAQQNSFPWTML